MARTSRPAAEAPLVTRAPEPRRSGRPGTGRGFGDALPEGRDGRRHGERRRSGRRRGPALSAHDRAPLGKHPGLEAVLARRQLHLPLAGRLTAEQVNRAWKLCAAQHHPDRGGEHAAMQRVNAARDRLLGRDLP